MTGIYLILNKVNNKVYIGQSTDIYRRWAEHLRSGQPEIYCKKSERDSKTPIHLAMQKYGIKNFELKVVEECIKEELNDKEKYWIKFYNSTDKTKGYNVSFGGQDTIGLKGEKHSQAKLIQSQVNEIIDLLKNSSLNYGEISQLYPFVNKSVFFMINQGRIWHNDKENYPLRPTDYGFKGEKNPKAKFTEKQVLEIRQKFSKGARPIDLYRQYEHIASRSAISAIIYNKTYKHLPKWNNLQKKWF